jgi:SAM-dependent methyltransferase
MTADRRAFHWVSSESGPAPALEELNRRMTSYYADGSTRSAYQQMVDDASETQEVVESALCAAVLARRPRTVLEVGAGSGRVYRRLSADRSALEFVGLEVAPQVVERNAREHPAARWICGSVYDADLPEGAFDVVVAYFVLEHLVYPARALARMAAWLRPGGAIFLVFPDFVATGRFASQRLGRVDGRARERLRRGDVVGAAVTLYDSRVRLRRALRRAVRDRGAFPINLSPRCLSDPADVSPDADAVYAASRAEVEAWARANGLRPRLPAGAAGPFHDVVFIELTREGEQT